MMNIYDIVKFNDSSLNLIKHLPCTSNSLSFILPVRMVRLGDIKHIAHNLSFSQ